MKTPYPASDAEKQIEKDNRSYVSPVKWTHSHDGLRCIQDAQGWPICNAFTDTGADQIVRAVNTIDEITAQRDALLEVVRLYVEFAPDQPSSLSAKARAAIALCERGEK